APVLDGAIRAWSASLARAMPPVSGAAPLRWITITGVALLASLAATSALLRRRIRRAPSATTVTWDCGYAAASGRMQYTASSFAQIVVHIFALALRPPVKAAHPHGAFPT